MNSFAVQHRLRCIGSHRRLNRYFPPFLILRQASTVGDSASMNLKAIGPASPCTPSARTRQARRAPWESENTCSPPSFHPVRFKPMIPLGLPSHRPSSRCSPWRHSFLSTSSPWQPMSSAGRSPSLTLGQSCKSRSTSPTPNASSGPEAGVKSTARMESQPACGFAILS